MSAYSGLGITLRLRHLQNCDCEQSQMLNTMYTCAVPEALEDTGSSQHLHYIAIALAGNLQQHEVNWRKEELGILFLPHLEANAHFQQYRVNGRKDE